MAELPYRPEHVNDAIANSDELSNEELGAFVRLQRAMWRAGGMLPVKDLGRFARAGKRWGAIAPAILRKLTVAGDMASCPEIMSMLVITRERRADAAEKATKAAEARWGKRGSAGVSAGHQGRPLNGRKPLKSPAVAMLGASSEQCLGDANQNQNPIVDKNIIGGGDAAGGRLAPGAEAEAMNRTLFGEGVELLVQRVGTRRLEARRQIARWLNDAGSEEALANLLAAAEGENLRGPNFVAVVDRRIAAQKEMRERGPRLPFPPQVVKAGGGDG